MKVVSIINYKGGVGKTTLTANLGAYAASRGKRVLLIDLDPQTQLTFNFIPKDDWVSKFMDKKTLRNCFEPVIKGAVEIKPLSELILPVRVGGKKLDIISSHLDLIDTDMELAAMIPAPTIPMLAANSLKVFSFLRKGLEELKDKYELVLIDCPPSFYVLVKNAIIASDYYLAPSKLDYLSVLGVENLQRSVKKLLDDYDNYMQILKDRRYLPVFLSMLGIVPTMVNYLKGDELIKANEKYRADLSSKGYVFKNVVRNSSSVFAPAPTIEVPVVLSKPSFFKGMRYKIAGELKQLGEEFLTRLNIAGV